MIPSRNLYLHPSSITRQNDSGISNKPRTKYETDEKVILNIGGFRHEIMSSTIAFAPNTRLYWLTQKRSESPNYDPSTGEYFFDRNPLWFPYILNYYRLGKIHCPSDTCGVQFREELEYWGIDENVIDSCCWDNFRKHKEAEQNLQTLEEFEGNKREGSMMGIESDSVNNDFDEDVIDLGGSYGQNTFERYIQKCKTDVWQILEDPSSSHLAQIYTFASMIFIVISVVTFCMETLPYFEKPNSIQQQFLFIIESICVTWFCVELGTRFLVCPCKKKFLKSVINWIDLCAVIPFFVSLGFSHDVKTIVVLRIVRLIRVFRIFKLSRHFYGLQILGYTLRASFRELLLLMFFLLIGVVIFSSLIYYAEKDTSKTKFTSIPSAFWWSIVTMTTIGYGDIVPTTLLGKIIGTMCAVCGVLVIALPVPVVVSNFSLYYSHAQSKTNKKFMNEFSKSNDEKLNVMQQWFNPVMTNRSSIVSVISKNSFYMSSPAAGTPGRSSPTHKNSYFNSRYPGLCNNDTIVETPYLPPSFLYSICKYPPHVSPARKYAKKIRLGKLFRSRTISEDENHSEETSKKRILYRNARRKSSASKNRDDQCFKDEQSLRLHDWRFQNIDDEKLRINVFPPSHSESESCCSFKEEAVNIRRANSSSSSSSSTSPSDQDKDDVKRKVSEYESVCSNRDNLSIVMGEKRKTSQLSNTSHHLTPLLCYNSQGNSSCATPQSAYLSANSTPAFVSKDHSLRSSRAVSRKGSSISQRSINSTRSLPMYTRKKTQGFSASQKSFGSLKSFHSGAMHANESYPNDENTRQLQEVSRRLSVYLKSKTGRRQSTASRSKSSSPGFSPHKLTRHGLQCPEIIENYDCDRSFSKLDENDKFMDANDFTHHLDDTFNECYESPKNADFGDDSTRNKEQDVLYSFDRNKEWKLTYSCDPLLKRNSISFDHCRVPMMQGEMNRKYSKSENCFC